MPDLFFSFGSQNYAHYLTNLSIFIANINESHLGVVELLERGISVVRSYTPGNRCALDKTIEDTFMWHEKSHGGAGGGVAGLSCILSKYICYQQWVKTVQE